MNNEQLQMILNALLTMGAEGKEVFIWWLVLDNALPVVGWLITFAGLVWIAKSLIDRWTTWNMFCELRDVLEVGSHGPMSPSESKETLTKALTLARKVKNEPRTL